MDNMMIVSIEFPNDVVSFKLNMQSAEELMESARPYNDGSRWGMKFSFEVAE